MTNADKIRSMSDDELESWYRSNCICTEARSCSGCKYDQGDCIFGEWLKKNAGQRQGKWIKLATGDYACNQCHYGYLIKHNYCPHCGAEMEG